MIHMNSNILIRNILLIDCTQSKKLSFFLSAIVGTNKAGLVNILHRVKLIIGVTQEIVMTKS